MEFTRSSLSSTLHSEAPLQEESHFLETDVHRFKNKHYHVIASSCYTKKSKGVFIAAKCNLNYTNLGSSRSDDGRITFCKIAYNGTKIALICFYAPNYSGQHFYDSMVSIFTEPPEYQLLTGGDFSAVWLHDIDRTGATESRDQ